MIKYYANINIYEYSILFDLEGTLVETIYQKSPKFLNQLNRDTKRSLINFGIPMDVLKNIKETVYLRNKAYEWIENNLDKNNINIIRHNIELFMRNYDIKAAHSSRLYNDTLMFLKTLNNHNIELGIVTNTSNEAAQYILNSLNISKYFKIVITRNIVKRLKPNINMIDLANLLLYNNVEWLIGDSSIDALTAKNANIKSIIIKRNGIVPKYEYDYYISSFKEAIPFFIK